MNGNGTNGNSNGRWKKKSAVKGVQMLAADVVGNVVEMVFLRYQHNFDNAFPILRQGFKSAVYYPIKALQKPIEWIIDHAASSIEGEEGRQTRHKQTEEQRLDGLLESAYHYTAAIGVGWGSLIVAEKGLSRLMHGKDMPKELPSRMWTTVDLPVHLGMAWFLGTKTMKPTTGAIKDITKKILQTLGWNENSAEQDSRFFIAYILPNYATLIPTVATMTGLYHAEKHGLIKEMNHGQFKGKWFGFEDHTHHFERADKAFTQDTPAATKGLLAVAEKLGVIVGHGVSRVTT